MPGRHADQTDRAQPRPEAELHRRDIAVERYLPGSGVLSANLFRRNISNYLRGVTTLETVPYASSPRYVLRQQNVGDAMTQGLELEAKFRLSDLWAEAPRIDVRSNASFFRSRVKGARPDNRLDRNRYTQTRSNRFRGVQLMLGGNLNERYNARSETQTATIQKSCQSLGLWTFSPTVALRVTASNLASRDYVTGSTVDGPDLQGVPVRETSQTTAPTFLNVQLRLELKV